MVDYRDWSHDPRGTPQGDRGGRVSGEEWADEETWVPRQRGAGDDGYAPPAGYRRVEPPQWSGPEPRWATSTDPALPRYSEYWQPPGADDQPEQSYPAAGYPAEPPTRYQPASSYQDSGYGADPYRPGQHRAGSYPAGGDVPSAGRYPSERYDEPTERFSGRQYPAAGFSREASGGYAEPQHSAPPYSAPQHSAPPYSAPQHSAPPYSAPPRQSGRHSAVPYPTSSYPPGGYRSEEEPRTAYPPPQVGNGYPGAPGAQIESPYSSAPYPAPPDPRYSSDANDQAPYPESRSAAPYSAAPYSSAPYPAAPGPSTPYSNGYGYDTPTESLPRAEAPYSAAPYSAAPRSAAPYSAAPYSAAPRSAAPYSAAPYSAAPRSAAPYRAPAYQPRRGSSAYPPATGRASIAVIEPGDPERRWGPVLAWTFSWFLVPLVLFLAWTLTLDGAAAATCVDAFGAPCLAPRAQALTTLIGALPAAAGAFAVSLLVALGLRPLTTWRAPTIGFAAAIVGSGIATIIGTSL